MRDLLGRKSERGEEFYDYLHQDIRQNWRRRDPGIYAQSAEEVLEGRKQIEECVITGTDVFDRLRYLDVTEICRWIGEGDIHQAGWRCQRRLLSQAGMAVGR